MLTNNDILDAVARLVAEKFPGEPVYRDFTPANFKRPSTLLELSGGKFYPNFSCGVVEIRPELTLTTFTLVDSYHQQEDTELTRRQMILLGLLLPGYIKAGDRAPHVLDEGKLENGLDYAAVTVTLSYTLNREEFMELQQYEPVGQLHIRTEVTSHG